MDTSTYYANIISNLKVGKRPSRQKLDPELEKSVLRDWEMSLENQSWQEVKKCICIAEFSHFNHPKELQELILKSFNTKKLPSDILIFLLGAAQIQLIEIKKNHNQKVPMAFIDQLKVLLHHKDLEVVEWSLRCTCDLGKQSLFLKESVMTIRLPKHQFFSKHYKNINQLINFLIRFWGP